MPRPYKTSLTRDQLRERARNAGRARQRPEVQLEAAVATVVKRAPILTPEQAERLAEVVASAPAPTAEQADRLRALLAPSASERSPR